MALWYGWLASALTRLVTSAYPCPVRTVPVLLAFSCGLGTIAQPWIPRNVLPRLLVAGGVDLQAPKVAQRSSAHMEGFPWLGFELGAGVSFAVHERWGWAVQGSWARQGYLIGLDSTCFPLMLNNARFEGRAWRQFPWTEVLEGSELYAAFGLGLSVQTAGTSDATEDPFITTTRYGALTRAYVAPELGIVRPVDDDRMEFAVRYVAHLSGTPAWLSACTGPDANARFSGKNDHLALVFRYHFGLPRDHTPEPPPMDVPYATRSTDTLLVLRTHRAAVRLRLWDDAEHDGDTISVLVNGRVALAHYELTPKHRGFRLLLEPGDNFVQVIAHNEGRVPPNTARAVLRTGRGRYDLLLKTGATRNAAIRVWRE